MGEETKEETAPPPIIANTVVTQGLDGKLQVYVAGNRMVGTANAQISADGLLVLAVLPYAYRLAGRNESKRPVYETKDNVIQFPVLESYRKRWAEEEAAESAAREDHEGETEIVPVTDDEPHDDDSA